MAVLSVTMSKHTYKQAGVDIHEAASFVDDIGALVKATQKKRKLANPLVNTNSLSFLLAVMVLEQSLNFYLSMTCSKMQGKTSLR